VSGETTDPTRMDAQSLMDAYDDACNDAVDAKDKEEREDAQEDAELLGGEILRRLQLLEWLVSHRGKPEKKTQALAIILAEDLEHVTYEELAAIVAKRRR